jgi:hypothetical protein
MRLFARNEKGQPASKVDVRSGSIVLKKSANWQFGIG